MAVLQRKATAGDYEWISPDGSGVADIDDLENVNITTPSNGQVLTYDSTAQEWKNADATGGGHTIENSSGTAATQRDNLKFEAPFTVTDDSSNDATIIDIDEAGNNELAEFTPPSQMSPGVSELTNLDDVSASNPSDGDILVYNSTTEMWEKSDSVKEIKSALTDSIGLSNDTFQFGTDGNGNYGYVKKVDGADTFFPFSKEDLEGLSIDISSWWIGYPNPATRTVNGEVIAVFWFVGVYADRDENLTCAYWDKYGREYYATSRITVSGSTVTCHSGWSSPYSCGLLILYKPSNSNN